MGISRIQYEPQSLTNYETLRGYPSAIYTHVITERGAVNAFPLVYIISICFYNMESVRNRSSYDQTYEIVIIMVI